LTDFQPKTMLNSPYHSPTPNIPTKSYFTDAIAKTVNGAAILNAKPLEKAVINTSDPQ
jgi:hypothetical protein